MEIYSKLAIIVLIIVAFGKAFGKAFEQFVTIKGDLAFEIYGHSLKVSPKNRLLTRTWGWQYQRYTQKLQFATIGYDFAHC